MTEKKKNTDTKKDVKANQTNSGNKTTGTKTTTRKSGSQSTASKSKTGTKSSGARTKTAKQKADETARKAKETTKKKAEEAAQKAKKTAENVADEAENMKNAAKDESFWDEAKESVSEGAKVINEEASSFADKVTNYSEMVFGKIRETTADVWKRSTEVSAETVNKAQAFAEKYRDKYEVGKLNDEKKKISTQLGMQVYLSLKNNENKLPAGFFDSKKVKSLIKQLEDIDKEIIELSEDKN